MCFAKTNKNNIVEIKDCTATGISQHLRNYQKEEFSKAFLEVSKKRVMLHLQTN